MLVGLSGKCCSGKNYISDQLEGMGYRVIDVDLLSKEVFNNSLDDIKELFGTSDRKEIGDIIFRDQTMRSKLEAIIHPRVYEEIYKESESREGEVLIINIPLLNDTEFVDKTDIIIWIKSPLILRIKRALKRDHYSFKTVISRIWSQRKLSAKHFSDSADIYYIKNGLKASRLRKDLKKVITRLQRG